MSKANLPQTDLLEELIAIIEHGKQQIAVQVNSALTVVYWQVDRRINEEILGNERASYGKQTVKQCATELSRKLNGYYL